MNEPDGGVVHVKLWITTIILGILSMIFVAVEFSCGLLDLLFFITIEVVQGVLVTLLLLPIVETFVEHE